MGGRSIPEIRTPFPSWPPRRRHRRLGVQQHELFAPLEPPSAWRRGVTKESLQRELSQKLREAFPASTSTSRRHRRQREER